MSIKTIIRDGEGTGYTAGVTDANALKVQVLPQSSRGIPPEDLSNLRQLREYMRDGSNSANMDVDGSTSSVEFQINAAVGLTRWITGIRVLLEGANFELNTQDFRRFGAATTNNTPLSNGVDVETIQSGTTTLITAEPIAYFGDFLNYVDSYKNLVNSVASQVDFFSGDFVFDQPVVLAEGSSDRVVVRINDDLTAIDSFRAIARGYQEFV